MDVIKYLKSEVDLLNYIESAIGRKAKNVGSNTYRFKTCPICNGGDHFNITTNKNLWNTFGNCGAGTIIDFYMAYYHKNVKEAVRELAEEFNLNFDNVLSSGQDDHLKTREKVKPTNSDLNVGSSQQESEKPSIDFTKYIEDYYNTKSISLSYFNERLLGGKALDDTFSNVFDELAGTYKFFTANPKDILPNEYLPRLSNIEAYENIIPVWKDGKIVNCILRRNDNKSTENQKVMNLKGINISLFNSEYLKEKNKKIFVTEGIFDCLSLEMLGYKAICLNSVNNINKFIELIKENKETCKDTDFVLALDNDDRGKEATKKIRIELKVLELKYSNLTENLEYKDINDFYVVDVEGLKKYISDFFLPSSLYQYMGNYFLNVKRNKLTKPAKTGFNNIDNLFNGGLYPGLYTIGAISSLGKTALCIQMADNLAKNGNHVLYFSLEMPTDELISRCISRRMFELDYKKCSEVSTLRVNNGRIDNCLPEYEKACNDFIKESSKSLTIVGSGDGKTPEDIDINFISAYVSTFIKETGIKPIVMIDYLQIIMPDPELKLTEKQTIDNIVKKLKNLSTRYYIPIMVISSFNRENYNNPVNFACFKESGGIEYASDFVLGFQLSELDQYSDITNSNDKAKKSQLIEKLHIAKKAIPRAITLVILKNRNGVSFSKQKMEFYPVNNMFVEV